MNKIKPLTLEETKIKEEMKHNCFWDNIHYKNDNSKKAFELLCHLEDFEVQYYELCNQVEKLIGENNDIEEKYISIRNAYNKVLEENINLKLEKSKSRNMIKGENDA